MMKKYCIVFVSLLLLMMAMPLQAFAVESVTAEISFVVRNAPGTVVIEAVGDAPLPEVTEFADTFSGAFEITYTEPGNYSYHIYQRLGERRDVIYSGVIYNVLVSVFVNEYDQLYTVVTLGTKGNPDKPEQIEFINEFEKESKPDTSSGTGIAGDEIDGSSDTDGSSADSNSSGSGDGSSSNGSNGNSPNGSSSDTSHGGALADSGNPGNPPTKSPLTGQLLRPVSLMIVMGILLIFVGIMLSRKDREDTESEA